ncbi:hypothetical protein ANN_10362 [Periplaneta americana]|uniref:Reverse transcriptase domain-containing protein n=1 Tax=Periplaneta americana TaxID=6978 RepID=A0ABQ8TP26_PERAM|nr:hypothetical protein ANN_10362 [Periplaneta americana]
MFAITFTVIAGAIATISSRIAVFSSSSVCDRCLQTYAFKWSQRKKSQGARSYRSLGQSQCNRISSRLILGVQFKVCHGSLYAVMWLADEPREFNLPTLPQRCITYEAEKLPSKYGVHSEEYVPIVSGTAGGFGCRYKDLRLKGLELMYSCTVRDLALSELRQDSSPVNIGFTNYDMNRVSESFCSRRGVKQGCILSPLLFNLFIDDIAEIMLREDIDAPVIEDVNIPVLLYADDLTLCSKSVKGLQKGLDKLQIYSRDWGLKVNTEKTKTMTFKNGCVYSKTETWTYEGRALNNVKSFVYLGGAIERRDQVTWAGRLRRGLEEIGMGFIIAEDCRNKRNVWRKVKKRLKDIDRQITEGECRDKVALEIQSMIKTNWGPNYISMELLEDVSFAVRERMWLQYDGAPSHFSVDVYSHLDDAFPVRWIGMGRPILYPARWTKSSLCSGVCDVSSKFAHPRDLLMDRSRRQPPLNSMQNAFSAALVPLIALRGPSQDSIDEKPRKKPQPGNLPGIESGPPGFTARLANRYSTDVD